MSLITSDFRKGLKFLVDDQPFEIIDFQHVKPGKGGAFVRTRLKNLKNESVLDKTFRSGERFEEGEFFERRLQYMYEEGGYCYFMDLKTYEQFPIQSSAIGNKACYLQENMETNVLFLKSEPLSIEFPAFVNLKVVDTEPGIRGDTAQGGNKPATLEGGLVLQVPLFIEKGDIVKVDTRTRMYLERAR